MAVPVPKTWLAAEFVDAAEANAEWRDVLNFLLAPPRASIFRNANLAATTTGVYTLVPFDAEVYDPYTPAMHDTVTNNSRMVAAETGLYQVHARCVWVANATGNREMHLRQNAAGLIGGGTGVLSVITGALAGGNSTVTTVTFDRLLNAGDYLEMFAFQSSGGNLDVTGGAANVALQCRMAAKQ